MDGLLGVATALVIGGGFLWAYFMLRTRRKEDIGKMYDISEDELPVPEAEEALKG